MPHPCRSPAPPGARRLARAFTIVEVMMAAGVMALVLTTSITTMQRAYLTLDTARNLTTASQIMASAMDNIRMLRWEDVSDASFTSTTSMDIDATFPDSVRNRFTLRRAVTEPVTDIKQIVLTISWTSYDGRTLSRSFTTYYARYGIHDYIYSNA